MREHGYDLRNYLQSNWWKLGFALVGKIHIICGDMDNFYLNLAVYRMEDFLTNSRNPYYGGSFQYGRPMKGHGWQPTTNYELIATMAKQIERNAPSRKKSWHYQIAEFYESVTENVRHGGHQVKNFLDFARTYA